MSIYDIAKPFLFQLDAERAHDLTLSTLRVAHKIKLLSHYPKPPIAKVRKVMGIEFPNPVGLAAGLDKNGMVIDPMAALGFGFIEIGTVTPRPQPGNPKPRLFRVPEAKAIINRFGFNNLGVDHLIEQVKHANYQGVLGINLGKNFDTPNDRALEDYLISMRKVYPYASYITINISSPNTKNLRDLQQKDSLNELLAGLKKEQKKLTDFYGQYIPIALKIAPDIHENELIEITDLLKKHQIDGVIATNTTLDRSHVQGLANAQESGGLSGAPLKSRSNWVIRKLSESLAGEIPIIGVGGILSGEDALEKIEAGASLVQLYSGLIYKGPALIHEVIDSLG
jgi:dihydroorotate dehydrogenase